MTNSTRVEIKDTGKPKVPTLNAKEIRRLFTAAIRLHPELVPLLAVLAALSFSHFTAYRKGKTTVRKMVNRPAPTSRAASSSDRP